MGFHFKKSDMIVCTDAKQLLEIARKLDALGGTDCEREEKVSRMQRIKTKILTGETIPFNWVVGIIASTGVRNRLDGQHSSKVFLELTPEEWSQVVFPIVIAWFEFDCDTPIDLAACFEQFNASWSSRSNEDLVGAHVGVHEELRGKVTPYVANKVTGGLLWYATKVLHHPKSPERKLQLIHGGDGTSEFLIFCGSFLTKHKTVEMMSDSVIAAIYHTVKDADPVDDPGVFSFWKNVAGGKAVVDADTAEYKLAEYLETFRDKKYLWPRPISRHFTKSAKRPSAMDTFATCLRAFYAARTGRKVGEIFMSAKGKDAATVIKDIAIPKLIEV